MTDFNSSAMLKKYNGLEIPKSIPMPDCALDSDEALFGYIVALKSRLQKINKLQEVIKAAYDEARVVGLGRINAAGLKSYPSSTLGNFVPRTTETITFPSAENGGKAAVATWVEQMYNRGELDFHDILNLTQARPTKEFVQVLEKRVDSHNKKVAGGEIAGEPLPKSPFVTLTKTQLTVPNVTVK